MGIFGHRGRLGSSALAAVALVVCGCADSVGEIDCSDDPDGFDDHSVACLESEDAFFELAHERAGDAAAVKLSVLSFSDTDARNVRFYDTNFYQLHDETYMFHMLNGHRFEGEDELDPIDGHFESIEDIYAWAYEQAELPLDMVFLNERLYADRFYQLWRQEPRAVGPAVLVHYEARTEPSPREELWAFELEFNDRVEHDRLSVYFEELLPRLDPVIADQVHWLVRSPHQEALAQQMEAGELKYHDRILRYSDLSTPGEVAVYNPGLTAGRLRMIRAGETITQSSANDILIFETTPDHLPPCRALITAQPQTPLAHINILAKSRGIPNLSIAGVTEDPDIDQLARIHGRVAIIANEPDEFRFVQMSPEDYQTWLALQEVPPKSVPEVDADKLPLAMPLEQLAFADAPELRPIIGGKECGDARPPGHRRGRAPTKPGRHHYPPLPRARRRVRGTDHQPTRHAGVHQPQRVQAPLPRARGGGRLRPALSDPDRTGGQGRGSRAPDGRRAARCRRQRGPAHDHPPKTDRSRHARAARELPEDRVPRSRPEPGPALS